MSAPIRFTAVLTHPIQYYAPWFRHIQEHAPEIALTVVYATQPTPEQQGVGFDRAFEWDVELSAGYRSVTVRAAKPGDQVSSKTFTGLDVPEIGAAIAATAPDVVMIAGWYSITLIRAIVACRRLGVPMLYRGDSHLLSGPTGWRRPLWSLKTRLLLRQFDGFLSPGSRVDEYLGWFGAPDYRIFRVPHAVDNQMFARSAARYQEAEARIAARHDFGITSDALVPIFVGRLAESKRPIDLVRAAATLGPNVSPLIVGSGRLETDLRDEATRLGVDLKLVGFLNQTELGRAYAVADCLVLPSDFSETWGLVVNEALATGLPVVVSDAVGCTPDLVRDGENGYVHVLGDVASLAAALEKIRQRKAGGHDWATGCRAVAAEFNFDAMTVALVRACRSVIRHSPGGEPDWSGAPQRIVATCGQMVIAGGLERMTFEVLRVLRERGMLTHSIVNGWESFRITRLAEASGATWSVGPYWYPLKRRRLTAGVALRMLVEVGRVSGNLLRLCWRVRPTHVLVPDFEAVLRNLPALAWLRLRGVRVISRLGTAPPPGRFYSNLWRRLINPVVDRFVANSDFTRRELLAHGIAAEKIETIENMAPRRHQPLPTDTVRIPGRVIFVGQIIPDKGLDLLVDAIARLRARGIDATLDIVGEIGGWEAPEYRGHRASVRDRTRQPDLVEAVNLLGYREDVPALLARASIHCCPSRPDLREGFGLVVLEAKLAGLPSVVTPSGNLPEMIEHTRNGWVCPRADAEAVAEGLEYFLTRPAELANAGRAALVSAGRYSEGRFAAAWARVFAGGEIEHAHAL